MEYMSIAQAAEAWGISTRRIQVLCAQNRIAGAFRIGNMWAIPKSADKPTDASISFASRKVETDCKEKAENCLMQLLSLRKKDLSVLLYEEIDRAMACLQNISGADYLRSFQAVTIDPLTKNVLSI